MKLTLGDDQALTGDSITDTLDRVTSAIRKEESERLKQSEDARRNTEKLLADQVIKTEQEAARIANIKKGIYWRCDRRASCEAFAISSLIWLTQIAIAVFGVIKIPENSTAGWIMVVVGAVSGLLRLAGSHWDIKPIKVAQAFREWRRSSLQKNEYKALSLDE